MKLVKTVRNLSSREQFVVWGGRRHVIEPFSTATIKTEIANALVEECHPLVKAVEEVDSYFDPEWTGKREWVYNTTGNLDLPEFITVKRIVNKKKVQVEIPNPHRKPKHIVHDYDRGQRRRTDGGDGFEGMGTVKIEISPYTRRSLPVNIANWILSRDSMVAFPGELKRSKEPGFEPDDTWTYEDICYYARSIGVKCKKESTVRNAAKKGEFGNISPDEAVEKEKIALLHKIFFATSHPHTPSMTKEKYESLLDGFRQEDRKEKRDAKPPPRKGSVGIGPEHTGTLSSL